MRIHLTLAQQFMLAGVIILALGMAATGWWVGEQIEDGVIRETADTTALYVDSVIAPRVQELARADALTPEHAAQLEELRRGTSLGQHIVAFKIWNGAGGVVYSTEPALIGRTFAMHGPLAQAWHGHVASEVSNLGDEENAFERGRWPKLLETYSPVRLIGTDRIIAVAEFYQTADELDAAVGAAKRRSWIVVGGVTLITYLLLAAFAQRASDTISGQQRMLRDQVAQLRDLLAQNEALHARVRGAAGRTADLTERVLRRISAELHDGPAQALALALLRLDHIGAPVPRVLAPVEQRGARMSVATHPNRRDDNADGNPQGAQDVEILRTVLRNALREVRDISAGLTLPELDKLTLPETVARAVRRHQQRTRTRVELIQEAVPATAPLQVKIAAYRLIEEALNNAFRHAGGVGQRVEVRGDAGKACGSVTLHIADRGPGFRIEEVQAAAGDTQHLGLVGMRERVVALGGVFHVESAPGQGTTITAHLPLQDLAEAEPAARAA